MSTGSNTYRLVIVLLPARFVADDIEDGSLFKETSNSSNSVFPRILEKLIVAHLVEKFPASLESDVSLPWSQEPATAP
jgi:hypothetical protein